MSGQRKQRALNLYGSHLPTAWHPRPQACRPGGLVPEPGLGGALGEIPESAPCTLGKSPGANLRHCRSKRAASSVRSWWGCQRWARWLLLCVGLLPGQLVLLLEAVSQPGPDPRPMLCVPLAPACGSDLPALQAVSVAGTSSTSYEAGPSPPSLGSGTPLLLSCSVMSNSFATPWTVARQAPLSMRILQARILEGVAISFSNPIPSPNTFGEWLKNPPALQDTQVRSLDWEDSPGGGHDNPLQYSGKSHGQRSHEGYSP